jgi:diguanylate cyclase (GGDEF)-like protein
MIIHDPSENTKGTVSLNNSKDYLRVSEALTNGMTLVLSADYDDIRQIRYDISFKILFIGLFFALAFSLIVISIVKRTIKPLKNLTDASIKISNGDYDVEIERSNIREINLLSTAFENMIMHLREYRNLQHRLAHRDSLTGLRNTTSYKRWVADFNQKIKKDDIAFGVAVFDINNLKEINDTYGHILGNELIATTAKIISETFKRSPVFRIGGDEFCVILQNKDLADKDTLFASFDSQCATACIEKENLKIPVSIAKGFSKFNCKTDTQFLDVFKWADSEMYKNKRDMKNSSN